MSAVAISMSRTNSFDYQARISAVDETGLVLYTTDIFQLASSGSIYSYDYYVDPNLSGYDYYVFSLYGSQPGTATWDSWVIPPIGSLNTIFPQALGVVHIALATSDYTPTYGQALSNSSRLVTSNWSPASNIGAIYSGISYYSQIPNAAYPSSPSVLGICINDQNTSNVQAPVCCITADFGGDYPSVDSGLYYFDGSGVVFSALSVNIEPPNTGGGDGSGGDSGSGGDGSGNGGVPPVVSERQDANDSHVWYWVAGGVALLVLILIIATVGYTVHKKRS